MATISNLELILQVKDVFSEGVNRLRNGMEQIQNSTKAYKSTVESLAGPVNQFKNTIVSLAAVAGAGGLARSFIEINASAEKTKLMLAGLMGSTEKATEAFNYLLQVSTEAPFSIGAMKDAFVKMQVAGLDPMKGSLVTLMDAISQFGGSDQDLQLAAVAMQQMAGKGVVSMEELRQQLGERIPTAMKAMAEGLGMSVAQLGKAIEGGSVTAQNGLDAMMSKFKEWYGGTGATMMTSWTGLISNLKVAWEKFMLALGESGIFDKVKNTLDGLLGKIEEMGAKGDLKAWGDRIATTVSSLINLFVSLAGIFSKVIDAIGPLLPALIQIIAYTKTFQVVLGGVIGLPLQFAAKIFGLIDAFKVLMNSGVITFFEKLKYAIYMNMTAGAASFSAASVSMVAAAAAAGYAIGSLIYYLIWGRKENEELAKAQERTAAALQNISKNEIELDKKLTALGFTTGSVTEKYNKFNEEVKKGTIIWNEQTGQYERVKQSAKEIGETYNKVVASIKEGSAEYIKIREKELNTISALYAYEETALEQAYKDGKVSLEQYLNKRKELQEDYVNKMIKLKEMEIELLKKNPEQNIVQIKSLQEEIVQLKIKSASEQLKVEQELKNETNKTQQDAFTAWKSLQELKLNSLQASLDLQNTIEETAVKNGLMRQSELLSNQLGRLQEFYNAKIAKAGETAQKIAETEGSESSGFREAMAERNNLQQELQQKIIASEQQISEARKQEEQGASKFVAEKTGDRVKAVEIAYQEQLDQLEKYHQQGLISETEYQETLSAMEDQHAEDKAKAEAEMINQTEKAYETHYANMADALNSMLDYLSAWGANIYAKTMWGEDSFFQQFSDAVKEVYADVVNTIKSTISGVSDSFASIKQAGISSLSDAQGYMSKLMNLYNTDIRGFYNYMTGAGKALAENVGMTVQEWTQRVADYINHVKGLMASLNDYIYSLQEQLAQARGDSALILEMWYEKEVSKLKEQYGEELQNTKEYYDAMLLLKELYLEKKKALDEEDTPTSSKSSSKNTSGGGGSAGSIAGEIINSLLPDLGTGSLAIAGGGTIAVNVQKDMKFDIGLNVNTSNPDLVERWMNDTFFPIFERRLKLKGINLE